MRVMNRTSFMAMPAGTIFCKGKPVYWEPPQVKGDTLETDFVARQWCWVSSTSSEDAFEKLERMLHDGISVPIEEDSGRDGCFDDKDLFLIYEAADLRLLKRDIDVALALLEPAKSGATTMRG